ncbi:unnamed protein product [Vitrella brassicaformis CCMP3155]|uniref:Uncharacterized protein n=1 Tax=Vitrella brassicaformis (strain CCMP3155) TaxID=1169540 RepID=A0A0G4FS26_VITBC|nr:unnamed protein product [Vitrella brassicaformis CCMP3155]|eukprot:CEM17479.1 unnamed protein product [Vitrella brassicaformis CCMP3155]
MDITSPNADDDPHKRGHKRRHESEDRDAQQPPRPSEKRRRLKTGRRGTKRKGHPRSVAEGPPLKKRRTSDSCIPGPSAGRQVGCWLHPPVQRQMDWLQLPPLQQPLIPEEQQQPPIDPPEQQEQPPADEDDPPGGNQNHQPQVEQQQAATASSSRKKRKRVGSRLRAETAALKASVASFCGDVSRQGDGEGDGGDGGDKGYSIRSKRRRDR